MSIVELIRKTAALEEGRRCFKELTEQHEVPALDLVLMQKAGAADCELLKIAAALRPDRPLATYENLGGTFR